MAEADDDGRAPPKNALFYIGQGRPGAPKTAAQRRYGYTGVPSGAEEFPGGSIPLRQVGGVQQLIQQSQQGGFGPGVAGVYGNADGVVGYQPSEEAPKGGAGNVAHRLGFLSGVHSLLNFFRGRGDDEQARAVSEWAQAHGVQNLNAGSSGGPMSPGGLPPLWDQRGIMGGSGVTDLFVPQDVVIAQLQRNNAGDTRPKGEGILSTEPTNDAADWNRRQNFQGKAATGVDFDPSVGMGSGLDTYQGKVVQGLFVDDRGYAHPNLLFNAKSGMYELPADYPKTPPPNNWASAPAAAQAKPPPPKPPSQ